LWVNIGLVRTDAGDTTGATTVIEQAREVYERLVRDHPTVTSFADGLADTLWALGRAHRRAGRTAEAAVALRRSVAPPESLTDPPIESRVNRAFSHALLASLAGRPGSTIAAAEGPAESDRAMIDLQRAVAAGYRDLTYLQTNTDLDLLRSRPDFRLLMMDLAMPAEPFTTAR